MKSILGFTVPKEREIQTVIPEMEETIVPRKSLVEIKFPGINKNLSYYNDQFLLREGDVVYVSGKLAGQPGQVVSVTTKFRIHTKDYERVLAKLDLTLHGSFTHVKSQMVCFGKIPLTPERFESWITPPADPQAPEEENDEVISGEGYVMDIYDLDACEDLRKIIWERGVNYYFDGNLKYLCVRNGVGTAFVKGEKWYRVDFTVDEGGLMTDIYCDCPYLGLCKHEASVVLALQILEKDTGYDFKTDFVALDRETFWQLVSMAEHITL